MLTFRQGDLDQWALPQVAACSLQFPHHRAGLTRGEPHASTALAMTFSGGLEPMQNKPKTQCESQPGQLTPRAV